MEKAMPKTPFREPALSNLVPDVHNGKGRAAWPDEEQESTNQINHNIALAIAGNQFNLRSSGSSMLTMVRLFTVFYRSPFLNNVPMILSCYVIYYY